MLTLLQRCHCPAVPFCYKALQNIAAATPAYQALASQSQQLQVPWTGDGLLLCSVFIICPCLLDCPKTDVELYRCFAGDLLGRAIALQVPADKPQQAPQKYDFAFDKVFAPAAGQVSQCPLITSLQFCTLPYSVLCFSAAVCAKCLQRVQAESATYGD